MKRIVFIVIVIWGLIAPVNAFGPTPQECFLNCMSESMDCRAECHTNHFGKECDEACEEKLNTCREICIRWYQE